MNSGDINSTDKCKNDKCYYKPSSDKCTNDKCVQNVKNESTNKCDKDKCKKEKNK
jgi:hypothetical protein